ncbi:ATP-dependent RNA helicase DDX35 [Kwoniella mangroviensis CBS 10435]|uniref:RNA helicase n=1 Tax=Kwoniella mangroviensis CBS 10435 TaxID=1331196 RepID=A0A1B9IIH0_9TREE|nr:ATP-dependent RNA helicase DDX35 [Kwoniella mangroviensis CBS 10435]
MPPLQFWKPGTAAPGSSLDRDTETEGSLLPSISSSRNEHLSLEAQRKRLPIYKHREKLLWCVEKHQVVIVVGQTGCGKSTQIPQYLHEAGWTSQNHVVACTQPRRVAATSVATRVAEEVGSVLGDEVGYSIRFEDLSSPTRTRIKYLTDGMLFRETMLDPLLSKYSVIMIDEAHERGAYTDLLLGLLKKIMRKRPELRVIISSATIDAEDFLEYFNTNADGTDRSKDDAIIVSLEGRMFPVEVCYLKEPCSDYAEAAVQTVFDIHMKEPAGDILVFLTGREEIDQVIQEVSDRIQTLPKSAPQILALPLYATLPPEEQAMIFDPPPRDTRKVIFSTNIAEASVTIDGIKYVVDSGFVKLKTFNPKTTMDVLSIVPCSLASANQRAGRAGRTSPGKCFRLYPSSVLPSPSNPHSPMTITTPPELTRSDISLYLLQLKALGIDNLVKFDFMSPPPSKMMIRSLEFLYCLKALDDEGRLTRPMGERMAEVPLDPMMAAILLNSHEFRCGEEVLTIAAMTSVQNVFNMSEGGTKGMMSEMERRKFTAEEGDHLTLLNAYNAFIRFGQNNKSWCGNHRLNHKALSRAVAIRKQLKKYLDRFGIPMVSCEGDAKRLRKCLVTGYFKNAARMMPDGTYRSAREGAILHVHPSSVMFTRQPSTGWVIYHEVVETTKSFMRDLTVIEEDWLVELAPHFYEFKGGGMKKHF